MPEDEAERRLVAFHVVGHALARWQAGAPFPRLERPQPGPVGRLSAFRRTAMNPMTAARIAYAGPWAETRAFWPDDLALDERLAGLSFHQYVTGAALGCHDGDLLQFGALARRPSPVQRDDGPRRTLQDDWDEELSELWPLLRALAERLDDHGDIDESDLQELAPSQDRGDESSLQRPT